MLVPYRREQLLSPDYLYMIKAPILILVAASLGVATAGPTEFPVFYRGSPARVFTLAGQRCLGVVDRWSPQAMTIRMPAAQDCGAVDYFLRITPSDVRKVDHNPPGFWPAAWHVVTRPFVWAGEGVAIGFFWVFCLLSAI
jgi:hypothetical protein